MPTKPLHFNENKPPEYRTVRGLSNNQISRWDSIESLPTYPSSPSLPNIFIVDEHNDFKV